MQLSFHKYQGTGNDFIIVDNRDEQFDAANLNLVRHLCHRKFGIGSDGLILIQNHPSLDFEMVFFNPDGSQSMCGNGSRCAVRFVMDQGIVSSKNTTHFLSTDGPHEAYLEGEIIHLKMSDVARKKVERYATHFQIDTGSPHYVKMCNDVKSLDVVKMGRAIRNSAPYKDKGINVNFVSIVRNNEINVRTYERGVEDETLSCGTGVTACAIAMHLQRDVNNVKINTAGGELSVRFETDKDGYHNVYLIGPAKKVYEGSIEVNR